MKLSERGRLLTLVCALGGVMAVSAHHASTAFDMSSEVVLDGIVTEFRLVNPHAYVYFDVRADGGDLQHWRCEMSSATSMKRLGWTVESLVPSEEVTITGALGRNEDNVCYLKDITFDDGTRIGRSDAFERGAGAQLAAASPAPAEAPAAVPRLANGQPNLSGSWVSQRGPGGRGGPGGPGGGPRGGPAGGGFGPPPGGGPRGPGGPRGYDPTEAGARAAQGYDQPFDDPAIACHPANIIFAWTHDQHVNEIRQNDSEITLQYGYMDLVRTIHLDQSEHPSSITPSVTGHSIGRWDGDTLVVDTVGFEPGVLVPIVGIMHSADMRITERFRLGDDGQTLTRAYTVHDPAFLKSDVNAEDVMLRTAEAYTPYNCTELSGDNNRR